MTERDESNCPNKQIIEKGFWISRDIREHEFGHVVKIDFTCSIKKDGEELAYLTGATGGDCNEVETKERSRRCGLAKYLMRTCFRDSKILGTENKGVDPLTDERWENDQMKKDAAQNCETIIYLACAPTPPSITTPYVACGSYMRGALEAEFNVLFAQLRLEFSGEILIEMGSFHLPDLELEFGKSKESAEKFIENHGNQWFFCKCKTNLMGACMGMAKDTQNI